MKKELDDLDNAVLAKENFQELMECIAQRDLEDDWDAIESRDRVLRCGLIDIETNIDPYRHVDIYAHRHRGLLVSASARLKLIF